MIFLFLILLSSPSYSLDYQKQELVFNNGKKLLVEVADNSEKREQGLMERTHLDKDGGMLFSFRSSRRLSFWMKNTYIPLSIAYFDKDRVLKEIYDMKPQNMMEKAQNTTSYPSQCFCQYALEVNQGWFKKNNIKKGSSFKLIPTSSKKPESK